ncbi:MAG TPA: malto-oligosyltrehalose synthase [Verrucomicrobiae bacterium]|jgi:(1->4)-alpha-D-glucan 1-alpha-D-glucosylmutase|nr:malto-oligosyltrehalose synthase [Verrucomicrobiae bacterium]
MKRIPGATYRLQFNRDFTFRHASEILSYLSDLGISDVYASPLFQAGPESTHGYDTCCYGKLNPNLGTDEDFERFTTALKDHKMGLLLDVVPNHMSATTSNAWWLDVLRNGRESEFAKFFDIDWSPNNPTLKNKVLLSVLEDHYGKVLESGKLQLAFMDGEFFISYYDRNFPVNGATLPADEKNNPAAVLVAFKGTPGNARSFDKLDVLIQRQHYRLAYWRVAPEEINYRRFFDIAEMVAVKMELPEAFHATHELVFEWLKAGKITGLRVDHPDGLWDPKEYLQRLQAAEPPPYVVVEKILSGDEQLSKDWPAEGTTGYDFLNRVNGLFVNRLNALALDEIYREFTGNNSSFAEIVCRNRRLVLEQSFASELNALTHRLRDIAAHARSGHDFTFAELRRALEEIAASFPVYRTYLTETTARVSEQDRNVIQKAVRDSSGRTVSQGERAVFEFIEHVLLLDLGGELDDAGLKSAREFVMKFQQLTGPAMAKGLEDTTFYQFNRLVSLNEVGGDPEKVGLTLEEFHAANSASARQWPHAMLASATHDTKRGEDARARLNVLSEMPFEWRAAVGRWSRMNRNHKTTVENAPAPDANDEYLFYQALIGAWFAGVEKTELKEFRARIAAFMLKAVKEAKVHTSWTDPNAAYEKAVGDFVERVLSDAGDNVFIDDCRSFARKVAFFGRFNSLSQTLLKIASPGMPDFYQGSELWDLNLVDPDNRRPVNYAARQKILSDVKKKFEAIQGDGREFFSTLLKDEEPGAMKLFLICRALDFRRTQRELFERGDYAPLSVVGEKQEHLCAFAREWNGKKVIVVVPRLVFGLTRGGEVPPLGEFWKDTVLMLPQSRAGSSFRNVLTGETMVAIEKKGDAALEAGRVLRNFPIALLEKI